MWIKLTDHLSKCPWRRGRGEEERRGWGMNDLCYFMCRYLTICCCCQSSRSIVFAKFVIWHKRVRSGEGGSGEGLEAFACCYSSFYCFANLYSLLPLNWLFHMIVLCTGRPCLDLLYFVLFGLFLPPFQFFGLWCVSFTPSVSELWFVSLSQLTAMTDKMWRVMK